MFYPDRTIRQRLFFENLRPPLCCVSSAWKGELSPCVCVCVVKYIQHKIDHFNQYVTYTSVALNIFTLYNYHHLSIFPYSETLHIILPSVRIPTCPQPLATTFLLSVFVNLAILGVLYKWNRMVFVLLYLAYFT